MRPVEAPAGFFRTVEVMKKTGATYRQLDYWATGGLIAGENPGSGMRRYFTPEDVRLITVLVRVSQALSHGGQGGGRVSMRVLAKVRDNLDMGFVMLDNNVSLHW